jgi:hypothetical protein
MKRFLIFLCLALAAVTAIYFFSKTQTAAPTNHVEKITVDASGINPLSQASQTNPVMPRSQQSSQPSPVQTNNDSISVQGYIQKKMADPQYDGKQPINFYGRVVDESNEPVAGASVDFQWTDLSPNGSSEAHMISDSVGFFSLLDKTGKRLLISVHKDGYYTTGSAFGSFEYANPGDGLFKPDQGNPVVFQLRKKGEGAELISKNAEITVGIGKITSLPLDDQTVLQVELLTNAQMSAKQWAAHVNIVNGGIQLALEEFPFEAPLDGYQSDMELTLDTPKPPTWGGTLYQGGQFYVKTATGYGRIQLKTISGKTFMLVEAFLNPTGSRNLEPQ